MNAHPGEIRPTTTARSIDGVLRFARSGDRSFLREQRSPYPFHITRPFRLDPALPHLATLYLQSASGGLYRDDRLSLTISTDSASAAHVTTQAATIVHDTKGLPVRQTTRLHAEADSFLAFTPDPTVLFPNAALISETQVTLAPDAQIILGEAYTWHDPTAADRPFEALSASVTIRTADGRLLAADRGAISGEDWLAQASPMGRYRAVGALFVLGRGAEAFDAAGLEQQLAAYGCLTGTSLLPNGVGSVVRLLASDGGTLARGLDATFEHAFTTLLGVAPIKRRK